MSYYIHSIPGRLRIKSLKVKQKLNASEDIKKILSTMQGLGTVEINHLAGSVLINYNRDVVNPDDITSLLERNDAYIKEKVTALGNLACKTVFGSVVEKSLEGSVLTYLAVLI